MPWTVQIIFTFKAFFLQTQQSSVKGVGQLAEKFVWSFLPPDFHRMALLEYLKQLAASKSSGVIFFNTFFSCDCITLKALALTKYSSEYSSYRRTDSKAFKTITSMSQ